jgi:hypothetical protein
LPLLAAPLTLNHLEAINGYISILAIFTISSEFLMEVNTKENPFSLLYMEALIYIAVKQAFTIVPNNYFNPGRYRVHSVLCV